jgi:lauroyl/myristoyl acyltransferase
MFKYYIYKFGQFCVTRLPLAWSYRIASFMSDVQYYCSFRDRMSVQNNLKVVLPPGADLAWHTREVFRNFGRYLVEFFRMARVIDKNFISQKVKIKNLEALQKALSKGKGVILVSGHIGNWELGGVLLSMLNFPITAVALPHKERPVNDLFNKQREARGVRVVQTSVAVRRSLETLKENKLVALVADRSFGIHGEILPFLGKNAMIPKGPALLSLKTGAPIVPCFLIREGTDDHFTMIIEDPIDPPQHCHGHVDEVILQATMQKYIRIIEDKIRQYPSQWLMFRKFWVE